MNVLRGKGAATGIGAGPARLLIGRLPGMEERSIGEGEVNAEVVRFDAAVAVADADMQRIGERAPSSAVSRELVDVHRLILGSPELTADARAAIGERHVAAEWAVRMVLEELRRSFSGIEDERLRARFDDVQAVADRLVDVLVHGPRVPLDQSFRGAVAVGLDVSPLDALELHRVGIAGLATEHGGPTSHAAILARTLGIPYVYGIRGLLAEVEPGEPLWVDGSSGEVVSSPDAGMVQILQERRRAQELREAAVAEARREPCVTTDGTSVSVGANVESAAEAAEAMDLGADEIGLVRTELLYLASKALPSEEAQLADALAILGAARGRPVTFRTLDVTEDKLPAGLHLEPVRNPALGPRGIRVSLRRPDLFRPQLRALLRAAAVGPVRILLPMISTVDEVVQSRAILAAVSRELAAEGIPHVAAVPVGAMIETPSAALTADHIAGVCDFLSVGTNDLAQYAFAADRQSEEMAYLYQPLHPAMLRLLGGIFTAARQAGRPVTVCGDMAADPAFAAVLLGLGLRSFSAPGRTVAFVKAAIRRASVRDAELMVRDAGELRTHAEVLHRAGSRGWKA